MTYGRGRIHDYVLTKTVQESSSDMYFSAVTSLEAKRKIMGVIMIKTRLMSAFFLATSLAIAPMAAYAENVTPGQGTSPAQGATPAQPTEQAKPAAGKRQLNPWVDCGIGAMIFTDTHWAAVTSNIIWDYGSTATTSATASPNNCESSRAKMQAALFINSTYENLAEETATGQGEHLTTLLNVFGCNSEHQPAAIREIRSAMGQAVITPNYANQTHNEKAANFFSIVDSSVNSNCAI